MIRNYLKIALRNIRRHKAFAFINIAGLSIGMACSILVLLWVRDELTYDRFNTKAADIYRLTAEASGFKVAISPGVMGVGLQAVLPQIKNSTKITEPGTNLLQVGERKFEEKGLFFADSTFLDMFSFPLLKGNRQNAMNNPNSILLTEDMARKYFGDEDPMGKIIRLNNHDNFVVNAVLANIPSNSHFQFDFLIPMSFIANTNNDLKDKIWDNFNFYTYLLLDEHYRNNPVALNTLTNQVDDIYKKHISEFKVKFTLQPLTSIHLHSSLQFELPGTGNIQYVNILFVVAVFILIVACINFMNLATARSARRAKEVGLRKVVGAARLQIIGQFLGESLLISLIAFLFAMLMVWLLLPLFNDIAGKKINMHLLDPGTISGLLAIALGVGLLSGIYPALYLSGFQPVKVLKGKIKSGVGSLIFRNTLVVVQFVVSIVLIVATTVVFNQLKYIRTKNLGFDKENLLYMNMTGDMWGKLDALRAELRQNTLTSQFSIIDNLPTYLFSGTVSVDWDGKDPKNQVIIPVLSVDESFVDVFKVKIRSGRNFSTETKSDSTNYLINEKAAAVMGMKPESAPGKMLNLWGRKGLIIGVVKDFNFKPIHRPIEPLIMNLNRGGGYIVIRMGPGNTEATIQALGRISKELNPNYPFSYGFLDQDLSNLYQTEQRMGTLFNIFAFLGIFISCLGLYGLSAFLAEQRTREIGVRKALGASITGIVYLLSKNFSRLIFLAMLLAVPIAWYGADSWLSGFAYRTDLNWIIFVFACLMALLIAMLTVSYESIKAARNNPISSLRAE